MSLRDILGFWYWRHLKYWQIFRLKHYFKYDEDGNPRPQLTRTDVEDALIRFSIAQELVDNILWDSDGALTIKDITS